MTLAFSHAHSYRIVRMTNPHGWRWRAECTCRDVTEWRWESNEAREDGRNHYFDHQRDMYRP